MIVRETGVRFRLVRQHDHGLASGELAAHWAGEIEPREAVLYAIANHDLAWEELDGEVLWNPETGKPYSFTSYPLRPKLEAYRRGLDRIQEREPYAACLCSMHYRGLEGDRKTPPSPAFQRAEEERQESIKRGLSERELGELERNFRLLRLCDELSLFVCLNEPGEHALPFGSEVFEFAGKRMRPVWHGSPKEPALSLDPNPFTGPFDLRVPYTTVDKGGRPGEGGRLALRVTP
jgi:hypothetical protein